MARPLKLTDSVRDAIRARRRSGATVDVLVAEFKLSRGTIAAAISDKAPRKPPPAKAPPPAPSAPPSEPPAGQEGPLEPRPPGDAPIDPIAILATVARDLKGLAEKASQSDDGAALIQLSRALNLTLGNIAKMTPPPAADPDEQPDMIAAARRARKKLHEYVDREFKRAS